MTTEIKLTATQKENGNFEVITASGLICAIIVKNGDLGWRVMSRSQRHNSRTHSATPQEAAKKYWHKSVSFTTLEVKLK